MAGPSISWVRVPGGKGMRIPCDGRPPDSLGRLNGINLEDVVGLLYEAVVDSTLWTEAVNQLAAAFGNAVTSITCFHQGKGESLTGASDPAFSGLYNQHYGALDPHAARLPPNSPVGTFGLAEELVSPAELEKTEYYNDFMKLMGTYYGVGGVLRRDENGTEVISLFRGKLQGPFSDDEQHILRRVGGHFHRARTVYHRIQALTQQADLLKGALDSLRCAVAVCDDRGRVMLANAEAVADLRGAGPLTVSARGFLTLHSAGAQDRLQAALREAAGGRPGCVTVPRKWPVPPLIVNCAALPPGPARKVALAWEPWRESQARDVQPELRVALGVSAAELQVALLIAEGLDTRTISEQLRVQPNTIRTHLKRIYAKTGAAGRADLARLVLQIAASLKMLRETERSNSAGGQHPSAECHRFRS